MIQRPSLSTLFLVAALACWLVLLASREPTAWSVLQSRRPVWTADTTGIGLSTSYDTAWGMPLFGKQFGGCFRESRLSNGFLLANLPAYFAALLVYAVLRLLPLPIWLVSYAAGLVAVGLTGLQWWFIGSFLAAIFRRRRVANDPSHHHGPA
jgi:hypothetical protein